MASCPATAHRGRGNLCERSERAMNDSTSRGDLVSSSVGDCKGGKERRSYRASASRPVYFTALGVHRSHTKAYTVEWQRSNEVRPIQGDCPSLQIALERLSPGFPSDSTPPLCPSLQVFSPREELDGVPVPGKLLIGSDLMHEAMTRTAKPCYTIQLPFLMPSPLQYLRMCLPGNEVVVGQRDPAALAYLTLGCPCIRPDRWRRRDSSDVVLYDR